MKDQHGPQMFMAPYGEKVVSGAIQSRKAGEDGGSLYIGSPGHRRLRSIQWRMATGMDPGIYMPERGYVRMKLPHGGHHDVPIEMVWIDHEAVSDDRDSVYKLVISQACEPMARFRVEYDVVEVKASDSEQLGKYFRMGQMDALVRRGSMYAIRRCAGFDEGEGDFPASCGLTYARLSASLTDSAADLGALIRYAPEFAGVGYDEDLEDALVMVRRRDEERAREMAREALPAAPERERVSGRRRGRGGRSRSA